MDGYSTIQKELSEAQAIEDAHDQTRALARVAEELLMAGEIREAENVAIQALTAATKSKDASDFLGVLEGLAGGFAEMGDRSFMPVLAREAWAASEKIADVSSRASVQRELKENWLLQVIPGYNPDSVGPGSTRLGDLLGIEEEVEVLSAVIAASDLQPPLALGLFGKWGSGKSFFMRMMEQQIRAQSMLGSKRFCQNVVQLWFNAWHYSDTDLWASLTAEIFEQLSLVVSGNTSVETAVYQRDQLLSAQVRKDQAERQKNEASEQLEILKQGKKTPASLALAVGILKGIFTEPSVEEELKKTERQVNHTLEETAHKLNYPSIEALKADLRDQKGTLKGWGQIWPILRLACRNAQSLLWLVCGLVVAIGVGVLLWIYLLWIEGVAASVLVMLLTLATAFAPTISVAQRVVRVLAGAQKKVNTILDEEQDKLDNLIAKTQKRADDAECDYQAAEKEISNMQDKLDSLRVDQQLVAFIQARHASTDYTRRQGSIGKARYDFEKLVAFLEQAKESAEDSSSTQAEHRRIDRIILYIDDLDRCPEAKVMDVLQAIHLLLAFELFVVVVGVDPRWLLHSVKRRSSDFQSGANEERNRALSVEYLEKIFQIPFTLRPMTDTGFERIIDILTQQHGGKQPSKEEKPAGGGITTSEFGLGRGISRQRRRVNAEYLAIDEWERKCMKRCSGLIPSPRIAKQFVNIYRLLRTSAAMTIDRDIPSDERQRQEWAMILLLAILIGYPTEATETLSSLIDGQVEKETLWWTFVISLCEARTTLGGTVTDGFASNKEGNTHRQKTMQSVDAPEILLRENDDTRIKAQSWRGLLHKLEHIRDLMPDSLADDCTAFIHWAPQVARYSFRLGLALLDAGQQDPSR